MEEVAPRKKQIISSRSFGTMVTTYDEVREAVSTYTARCRKAAAGSILCGGVQVFVQTNQFREQDAQYNNAILIALTADTNDIRQLTDAALYGLEQIYRRGYLYKRAEVMLMELSPETVGQTSLFHVLDPR